MPFLKRGKARYERKRYTQQVPAAPVALPQSVVEDSPTNSEISTPEAEETKISYQEVTYRVPKEERLLDLPLEEEVFGEQDTSVPDEKAYNITPVTNSVPIGVALKKKKRR